MQKVTLIGRLGDDAKKVSGKNGQFISMRLAVSGRMKEDETTWYSIMVSNPSYQGKMFDYLTKGASLIVTGDLSVRFKNEEAGIKYNNLDVFADWIGFTPSTKRDENASQTSTPSTTTNQLPNDVVVNENISCGTLTKKDSVPTSSDDDDDLPF